jgi:ATP-dependent exoDNAse (exonuclease V) beta subunit
LPKLKVIRASAGSGKTFALTGEYLRLLFAESDYFEHILAVTFTNRATNEMKARIIGELDRLAKDQPSKQLEGIMGATGLSEQQVRLKAKVILKVLLHRYSSFSVSTIDAFFQRIIRSFTRELGLQGIYSIELDTGAVLLAAIEQLMKEAEKDPSLASWLVSYAESLIERGENWNFRKSMQNLGNEIFREEFKSRSRGTDNQIPDRTFLKAFRQELHASRTVIEKEYRSFGNKAMAILDKSRLTVDDFSNKTRGPAGFLAKLVSEYREPTATAIQAAEVPEKWFTKSSPHATTIQALAENELMPLMRDVILHYATHARQYYTLEVVLKNLFTLGILADLSLLTDRWCSENNTFLLPEAPDFLHRIIDDNDTPFIYEKAGYWFHHFMIDEFQDTSMLQWLNFKPLISNSLSQDYDNLLVGDVKQSIYRWRNSNWSILAGGLEKDFPAGILDRKDLDHNWRSGKNIIDFNNQFFRRASAILEDEFTALLTADGFTGGTFGPAPITGIYGDLHQEPGKDQEPGLVEVNLLPDSGEGYGEMVSVELVDRLNHLLDAGYSPSGIAIITRKNSEARQLAEFLLDPSRVEGSRRFEVISDEALRIGRSSVIVFLVSLLKYLADNRDRNASYLIHSFILNHSAEPGLPATDPASREARLRDLLPAGFHALNEATETVPLPEVLERLILMFNLSGYPGEQVYINALRDMIQDYGGRYSASLLDFLEYWDESGKNKSVSAPEGQNAIRILTIHKAKGLEFEVVILPYVTWELNSAFNTILWCNTAIPPFDKLGVLPVNYNGSLKKTHFAADYYNEMLNQYIDNLNLLYVAFTRAAKAMYIFCKDGTEGLKNSADLTRSVVRQVFGSETAYRVGELPRPQPATEAGEPLPEGQSELTVKEVTNRIRVAVQGKLVIDPSIDKPRRPVNEGSILHEIFSHIRTLQDVEAAIELVCLRGMISRPEKNGYTAKITHILNEIQESWFGSDWEILTEAEIILPGGQTRRPDRVMVKDGATLVVDYKFGEQELPSHRDQVTRYCELLSQMGYTGVKGYLWYALSGKVLNVFGEGRS